MTVEKEKLVTDNIKLAHYIANRYRGLSVDFEEIVSCAYLGLTKAALTYDSSKGIKFSTYAGRVMTNEILQCERREGKHNKVVILSMETPVADGITIEDTILDPKDYYGDVENRVAVMEGAGSLTAIEKKLLEIKTRNPEITQEELSATLGFTQSYVSRLLKSARTKLLQSA